jgi:hypothetical protein
VRSWYVIPALGGVAGGAALALGCTPWLGLTGAALAAAVRALAGDTPAALTAAALAPVLAVASLAEAGAATPRAALALAGAAWAVAELARDRDATTPPIVALVPAAIAGVLDPSFVALVAVLGLRLRSLPTPRLRVAVAVAGTLGIVLAVLAGTAWPELGARWFGGPARPVALPVLAVSAAITLGPLTSVAALAGLGTLVRPRCAELAVAVAVAGAVLVGLRAGALGPAAIGCAALLAALAIGRLVATIRVASGQAIVGATLGALLVLPPAWTAVAHRSRVAHIGHASR